MLLRIATLVLCFALSPMVAKAQETRLTAEQWREDIAALTGAIKEHHPDPFWSASEEEFDKATADLIRDLPAFSDKDIALRLAAIVARVEDGHTRLSLPRAHPAFGFNPSHTGPDKAAHETLTFSTLPFRFYLFEEGLFIIEAAEGHEQYIGARVVAFGETSTEDAIVAAKPILYAENDMGAKVLAADRLALPDVLQHVGLIDNVSSVSMVLEKDNEVNAVNIAPLAKSAKPKIVSASFEAPLLRRQNPDDLKWHERIAGERAWYIQLDEIEAFPEVLLSDFLAEALQQAKRARAKSILLDLRVNHGGTGSFNPSVINALAQSGYNEYGLLFVLTGRETFSAAASLMSAFEQYTNAIFVGEPAGARPSSYGDPQRIQLPNSNLTLRVSTIFWRSWLAGEFRPFIETHIDAPIRAADYFAGRDAAIEAALSYAPPVSIASQMAELFEKEKLQSGLLRFLTWLNSPSSNGHDAADDLIAYGHRYLDDGELRKGRFMMVMARDYYPTSASARAGLGRAMELIDDLESARRRYKEALELDPNNVMAKEGLARLAAKR